MTQKKWLFVTGKLAEPALRRILAELSPKVGFEYQIITLNITVAALMTTEWVARHFPKNVTGDIILLPGLCRGSADVVAQATGIPTRHGPQDLLDIPEFFNQKNQIPPKDYGKYDIEIIAEINSVPHKSWDTILAEAQKYRSEGADIIDIGCDPDISHPQVADTIRRLRELGFRTSIDSLQPEEIESAINAGAELVLSINSSNIKYVPRWLEHSPTTEFVVIPDNSNDLSSLYKNVELLLQWNVRIRLDPILEPIGYGFFDSLLRYVTVRKRYPDIPMLMGVGNLTELTEVDSVGINVLLAAICQELKIQSILTTSVANWSRSSVKELDLARRLVYYAIQHQTIPKRIEPNLVLLRDSKLRVMGENTIHEIAEHIRDKNYRIITERDIIYIFNKDIYLQGTEPFELFQQLLQLDQYISPSHAFYLGYEMAKAKIAMILNKNYVQDQPLKWGFLTSKEKSVHSEN
jgi:dihydropteroate synthase-like protein